MYQLGNSEPKANPIEIIVTSLCFFVSLSPNRPIKGGSLQNNGGETAKAGNWVLVGVAWNDDGPLAGCADSIARAGAGSWKHRNLHAGRKFLRSVDPLCRFLIIGILSLENVGKEFLRVAVVDRKPGALYLDHDAVSFFENVILRVQIDGVGLDFVRSDGFGLFKRFAETAAEDFVGDHQFVAGKLPVAGILLRIDIDKFDHPIAVRASGRSE